MAPIRFLEHKCMIINFMATYTYLLALKATSRRDIAVCQINDREEETPTLIFFFAKYEVSLSHGAHKDPSHCQIYMNILFTNYPKVVRLPVKE